MKHKLPLAAFCCGLFLSALFLNTVPASAGNDTAGETQSLIDGIAAYEEKKTGADSVQAWLNGALVSGAGTTSEWYVVGLRQSGETLDYSAYGAALHDYVTNNRPSGAAARQRCALALIAAGRGNDSFVRETAADSIGAQGIMTWTYGLHLLNNGVEPGKYAAEDVVEKLLSLRFADGGWALSGSHGDADVTAMTISALAPYASADPSVKTALDGAFAFLSGKQQPDGDFSSYGSDNAESTAQVITALASAGIDPLSDSRFIKNGHTLLDGLKKYRLSDGSFCHAAGGASNDSATVQAFYSLIALRRVQTGRGPLMIFGSFAPVKKAAAPVSSAAAPASSSPQAASSAAPSASSAAVSSAAASGAASSAAPKDSSGASSAASDPAVSGSAASSGNETSSGGGSSSGSAAASASSGASSFAGSSAAESASAASSGASSSGDAGAQGSAGLKLWLCAAVAAAAAAACLILRCRKKGNRKNYLFVVILAACAAAILLTVNIQSRESYYGAKTAESGPAGSVTMTIRCDTIVGKSKSEHVPADGVILPQKQFGISEGDTVYDVLVRAAKQYGIQMEKKDISGGTAYIEGINYLYEFGYGDLSGWVYHVNGTEPSVGCSEYRLKNGDKVEWLYTCSLGEDVR